MVFFAIGLTTDITEIPVSIYPIIRNTLYNWTLVMSYLNKSLSDIGQILI